MSVLQYLHITPSLYCNQLRELFLAIWFVFIRAGLGNIVDTLVMCGVGFGFAYCVTLLLRSDLCIEGAAKYSLHSLLCGLLPFVCAGLLIPLSGFCYIPGLVSIPSTIWAYRKLQVPGCTGWAKLRYVFPFVVQGRM